MRLWGCIIGKVGRTPVDGDEVIQSMVNLCSGDPPMKVRPAAAQLAKAMGGTLSTHVERIRRLYRRLQRAGKLPKPETPESRLSLQIDQVKAMYAAHAEYLADLERQLAAAESEAEALGFDLDPDEVLKKLSSLKEERTYLESLLGGQASSAFTALLNRGIEDPEEAAAYLAEAAKTLQALHRSIAVLARASDLRSTLYPDLVIDFPRRF